METIVISFPTIGLAWCCLQTHEIEYLQSIQQHLEKQAQNVETRNEKTP